MHTLIPYWFDTDLDIKDPTIGDAHGTGNAYPSGIPDLTFVLKDS